MPVVLDRFDAVHVAPGHDNGTFFARTMNYGEAILKVSRQLQLCHFPFSLSSLSREYMASYLQKTRLLLPIIGSTNCLG